MYYQLDAKVLRPFEDQRHGGFWSTTLFLEANCTRSISWPRAKHTGEYKHFIPLGPSVGQHTRNKEQRPPTNTAAAAISSFPNIFVATSNLIFPPEKQKLFHQSIFRHEKIIILEIIFEPILREFIKLLTILLNCK